MKQSLKPVTVKDIRIIQVLLGHKKIDYLLRRTMSRRTRFPIQKAAGRV